MKAFTWLGRGILIGTQAFVGLVLFVAINLNRIAADKAESDE